MKNKKIIPLIIKIVSSVIVLIAIILIFKICDTVNVNNNASLVSYIEKREHSSNIEIKKKKDYGKLCFLLYTTNNNSSNEYKLIILSRDNILRNRYGFFGSSGSSFKTDPVEIYIFPHSDYNLFVVFGNNSKLHASKYEILNNNEILYDENLNVNQYILGVYKVDPNNVFSNKVEFFNNEGIRVF